MLSRGCSTIHVPAIAATRYSKRANLGWRDGVIHRTNIEYITTLDLEQLPAGIYRLVGKNNITK